MKYVEKQLNCVLFYYIFELGVDDLSITAQKIAELAGVSRGTVDRALKNRPGVNPKTKEKVLKIAKEYNYKPNLIGKALAYSNHYVKIEVILNSIGNSFFDEIKRGLLYGQSAFSDYGLKINITEVKGYNSEIIINAIDSLPKDVKNIILTPVDDEKIVRKINELTEKGINVVLLSSDVTEAKRLTYVGCDYLKSGKVAGRLVGLLSGGKSKVCIVTGSLLHKGHRLRVEGVRSITDQYKDIEIVDVVNNNDDNDIAYKTMKSVLSQHNDLDFVCITAGGVTGTLKAIKESNRNIKVCSFDDTATTREALKNGQILATICQQPFEQGYNSVKSIFNLVVAKKEVESCQYTKLYVIVDESI